MGVEDRDWFRDGPDRLGGSSGGGRFRSSGGSRVHRGAWLAIAVSFVVTAATWHYDFLHIRIPASEPAPNVVPPLPVQAQAPVGQRPGSSAPANVVRLRSSPGLDVPATVVAKWSVSGPRFGTVSVVVPVGKTPREALTVAFAERGFQVVG